MGTLENQETTNTPEIEATQKKTLEENTEVSDVKEKENKKSKKKAQRSETKSLIPDASKDTTDEKKDKEKSLFIPGYIEKDDDDNIKVESVVPDASKDKHAEKKRIALEEMKAKEEEEIRKVKEKATKHVLEETTSEAEKLVASQDGFEKGEIKATKSTQNEEELKYELNAIKRGTSEADKEMKIALEEAEKQKVMSQETILEPSEKRELVD